MTDNPTGPAIRESSPGIVTVVNADTGETITLDLEESTISSASDQIELVVLKAEPEPELEPEPVDAEDDTEPVHTASTHPVLRLVEILRDLTRCDHGRQQGDRCLFCEGISQGNPLLPPGTPVGYGINGEPMWMPTRDQVTDPDAWFTPPTDD